MGDHQGAIDSNLGCESARHLLPILSPGRRGGGRQPGGVIAVRALAGRELTGQHPVSK